MFVAALSCEGSGASWVRSALHDLSIPAPDLWHMGPGVPREADCVLRRMWAQLVDLHPPACRCAGLSARRASAPACRRAGARTLGRRHAGAPAPGQPAGQPWPPAAHPPPPDVGSPGPSPHPPLSAQSEMSICPLVSVCPWAVSGRCDFQHLSLHPRAKLT